MALETISHSRDMAGAHKNFNGSRNLKTPLSGMVCHPWASIFYVNLPTKFEVATSTHDEDTNSDTKCQEWGGSG